MPDAIENTQLTTILVVCGTVLLVAGFARGWDLISLAMGVQVGLSAK